MRATPFPLQKIIALILLTVFTKHVKAQDSLYAMLSRGSLPSWVNMPPERQLSLVNAEKKAEGYKLSKVMKNILSATTDIQYSYLRSGSLLFNDEASELATAIANKLLKGEVALRNSLKIYVAYTNNTNIIVCPTGLMIIDLGLFAQLENEHQLAFMISHELAHLNNADLITSEAPINFSPLTPELRDYAYRRRIREHMADSVGYEMYLKAGYSPAQALRTFDVLGRNWLVPEPLAFSTSPFADSLDIRTDTCSDGVDESEYFNSTQIEYSERQNTLSTTFNISSKDNELLLPSAEFKRVNRLAIYNCGLHALQTRQTAAALYLGYYLHQTDSTIRDEADLLIAKALYVHAAINSTEHEGYTTVNETVSDNEIYFENISSKKEESPIDERGYIAGAALFLNELNPMELAIISVRWSWPYSLRTARHKQLADELAGHSVNMLNMTKSTPFANIGNIGIEKTVRIRLKPIGENELTDEEQRIKDEQKWENDQLNNLVKIAEREGIDVSARIDSVRNIRRETQPAPRYKQKEFYVNNHQLRIFEQDSAFKRFYERNAPDSASSLLVAQPNVLVLKGDSVYLMDVQYYFFQQKPGIDHFDYNYEKSVKLTHKAGEDSYKAGKKYGIAVVSPGRENPKGMSTTEYNAFCIACRIKEEAEGYKNELFTYPLAFKEEFTALQRIVHIRYFMTHFSLIRQLSGGTEFSYRETVGIDLNTGRKSWILLRMGKGSVAGPAHMRNFFKMLTTRS